MRLAKFVFTCFAIVLICMDGECQPEGRINGQTPAKWITVKHTISPNRSLQYKGQNYVADFEDIYAKIWLPVVLKDRLKIGVAPFYRTEQVEFESTTNAELNSISQWNLRSAGVDLKTVAKFNDGKSLVLGGSISHSATIQSVPLRSSPVNYSFSAVYMRRISPDKETGFGMLRSNGMGTIPFLPILMWNQTFTKHDGIEICLPYKLAWRHNFSDRDIVHIKAEGQNRSYYVDITKEQQCRRLDVDLGIAYTRMVNKWIGFELFGAFRQNLSTELPHDISLRNPSGFSFSTELFVVPAFKRKSEK